MSTSLLDAPPYLEDASLVPPCEDESLAAEPVADDEVAALVHLQTLMIMYGKMFK